MELEEATKVRKALKSQNVQPGQLDAHRHAHKHTTCTTTTIHVKTIDTDQLPVSLISAALGLPMYTRHVVYKSYWEQSETL